jgi:hypothetical protein
MMDNTNFGTATAPAPDPKSTGTPGSPDQQFAALELERAVKSGGSWFYWIAGLTCVNTFAAVAGSDWRFLLGLGITQVADELAKNLGSAGAMAALTIDVLAVGFFVLMGVFANKVHKWAFIVGMAVFGLDTGISVLAKDVIGVLFHLYALWCIYRGYSNIQKLRDLRDFGVSPTA